MRKRAAVFFGHQRGGWPGSSGFPIGTLVGTNTSDGGKGCPAPGGPGTVVTGRESYGSCRAVVSAIVPTRWTTCGVTMM